MDDEADVEGGRGAERVHRVTVRGQFRDLSEQSRQFLVRSKAEHDIFVSAYTPEGTFTYDDRIQFFNLRYEIRYGGDDPIGLAAMTGEVEADLNEIFFVAGQVYDSWLRPPSTTKISPVT